MDDVEIRRGHFPGSIGLVLELHARYYHAHWGFGMLFEAQLARGLAEFFGRYDELRDGFWVATESAQVEGSITIDGVHAADTGAHLRWFIMSDALRGKGVRTRLIHTDVDFCRAKRYRRVCLRTFAGLFVVDDGAKLKLLRSIASHLKPGAPLVLMDAHGDPTTPESQLLLDAWKHQQNLAGVKWEQVESSMKERMQAIHFVSSNRIEELLAEAGFCRIQCFFQIFILGGWIAFKG